MYVCTREHKSTLLLFTSKYFGSNIEWQGGSLGQLHLHAYQPDHKGHQQQVVLRSYPLFHDVECKPLIMAVRSGRADITEILLEGGTIDLDIISPFE